ncbi:MAG: RsmE family RNA methyltransferase [Candidatus Cloacimonadota bacterium]|nr:RsmE family RNA methyltransferase [Candidatus Cloacimonadota bacterium]
MPIFYAPQINKKSQKIEIIGEEFNHITNSLRKKTDESISLTNGKGLLASANIQSISKKEISLHITEITETKKSYPYISLSFSLLKKNNELIIEKCTELGIYEFFPFISTRTVKKNYSRNFVKRLDKVAISAMKQCDSVFLPQIHPTLLFPEQLSLIAQKYFPILAWEEENKNFLPEVLGSTEKNICLIVGPEGGFEKQEIEIARNHKAKVISLGNHILRAETAAISFASNVIFYQLGKNKKFY